ncbi:MAG: hypothetical protein BWY58_01201 [Chloroflexi bacterium ADurb.Bin344]|nr:MAG: hypothetical protein BWY58_01201 [Chloroflexi bacterium ADurb.Bin344]
MIGYNQGINQSITVFPVTCHLVFGDIQCLTNELL